MYTSLLEIRTSPWTYSPRTLSPGQFPSLSTWCRTFHLPPPPSANLRYKACTKLIAADRLGSGVRVSVSFQKILSLVGRLESGLRVVGRLGSGIWVSATSNYRRGKNAVGGEGNCPGGRNVRLLRVCATEDQSADRRTDRGMDGHGSAPDGRAVRAVTRTPSATAAALHLSDASDATTAT